MWHHEISSDRKQRTKERIKKMEKENQEGMENKEHATQVQIEYMKIMPVARMLNEKRLNGTITAQEKMKLDQILEYLWLIIHNYALKEGWLMSSKYRRDSDYFADLTQELHLMWLTKLWNYDPQMNAPTTYFSRYFRQCIREFAVANSQKMKQSQATNISKVRAAKAYLESQGIKYDDSLLAEYAGLSLKVTRETLQIMDNSIHANIEDSLNQISDYKSPESINMDIAESELLVQAISENLSELEMRVFLSYTDYNDSYYQVEDENHTEEEIEEYRSKFKSHYKSLTALAEEFDMSTKDISAIINSCRKKLSSDSRIRDLYGKPNKKQRATIKINENKDNLVTEIQIALFMEDDRDEE